MLKDKRYLNSENSGNCLIYFPYMFVQEEPISFRGKTHFDV